MKTVTVVSDLHVGSSLGLCPEGGILMGEQGKYLPSKLQQSVRQAWEGFFNYADRLSQGADSTTLVINGDAVDGVHHNTVALATNNIEVQESAAIQVLTAVKPRFDRIYMVKGTEAHAGR